MITVNTKAFTKELEWAARFIERKTTIPILQNVLLHKAGNELYISGTDLEIGAVTSVEADGPDFDLTVPVHSLLKYLKKVDDPTLSLAPAFTYYDPPEPKLGPHMAECYGTGFDGCCEPIGEPGVSSAKLRINHGEDFSVTIDGMSVASYPELPTRPLQCIELRGLEKAIPRVCVSISNEESRFTLTGALLLIKGKTAKLLSTDGHRLSVVELITAEDPGNVKSMIPRKALAEVLRLGDSAFFNEDENHAFFQVGERLILTRKLTGSFPDWERVMPKDLLYSVTVANAPLRKVIDRVAVFADDRSHGIQFTVNGAVSIASCTHENGSAKGSVSFSDSIRKLDGENGYMPLESGFAYPYRSGFNAEQVTDFLKASEASEVRFRFHKANHAVQFEAPGWQYVLMPFRADNEDPIERGACEPVPAVIEALAAHRPLPELEPIGGWASIGVTIPEIPREPVQAEAIAIPEVAATPEPPATTVDTSATPKRAKKPAAVSYADRMKAWSAAA